MEQHSASGKEQSWDVNRLCEAVNELRESAETVRTYSWDPATRRSDEQLSKIVLDLHIVAAIVESLMRQWVMVEMQMAAVWEPHLGYRSRSRAFAQLETTARDHHRHQDVITTALVVVQLKLGLLATSLPAAANVAVTPDIIHRIKSAADALGEYLGTDGLGDCLD